MLLRFVILCLLGANALWATEPRFYAVVFANDPQRVIPNVDTHTYAMYIKMAPKSAASRIENQGDWDVTAFTISWLPARLPICVLCPPTTGYNYSLHETFQIAQAAGAGIFAFPPIEVSEDFYLAAFQQFGRLSSGAVAYVVNDRRTRPNALNCVHAVVDVDLSAGYLLTGLARGVAGSRIAYRHYSRHAIRADFVPSWIYQSLGMEAFPIRYLAR